MNIFKEIFARIWAAWGLVIFTITLCIAFIFYLPCFVLKDPAKARWHRHVSRVWMWVFLHIIGCPLKIVGREYFRVGENYVIVCNHNSMMDVPVTTPFMPRANKTIAKKSMSYIPVFGWIYGFGSILVDRKSEQSRKASYIAMRHILAMGMDMLIYPEGSRNRTNDPLKSFYDGAFKLAVDTKKPILATILFNSRTVMPVNKFFYLWPHRLEMHFLPSIDSNDITAAQLKEKIFRIMWDYYEANR